MVRASRDWHLPGRVGSLGDAAMRTEIAALLLCLAFVVGWGCGGYARGTIQEQFVELSGQQRVDFIYAMSTPEIRRAIAEDWCAINRRTRGVCGRARLQHPIRGAK